MLGRENLSQKKIEKAERRISLVLSRMKSDMPFLQESLAIFEPAPVSGDMEQKSLYTDGKKLFYDPEMVLQKNEKTLRRQVLHITMHGLSGHFDERHKLKDKELADAVMDMQAERLSQVMEKALMSDQEREKNCGKEVQKETETDIDMPELVTGLGTYYRGKKNEKLREKILERSGRVRCDTHSTWHRDDNGQDAIATGTVEGLKLKKGRIRSADEWSAARENLFGSASASMSDLPKILAGRLMKDSKKYGKESGSREHETDGLKNPCGDYRELLQNLRQLSCRHREEDSPDPVYYSYGMELYEDMPLIEPIDEGEIPALDTMVIAVDTSGSCENALPLFLEETRNLLQELKETVDVNDVLYLECDATIKKEKEYSVDDMIDFFTGKHVYGGLGGTDFRPVFNRINEYRQDGKKISCLLYYTDGIGSYPEEAADYPCYFIMPGKEAGDHSSFLPWMWHEPGNIPDWIERLRLD